MATGVIAGYSLMDVRVIVYDGKHHSVDSKEIAFATAGRKAFLAAIREARPSVLEPIVHIEISASDATMGDITGDLSAKRGLVTGTSNGAAGQVVRYEGFFTPKSSDPARVLLQLRTAGVRVSFSLLHFELGHNAFD